jgi:hypothetical protein
LYYVVVVVVVVVVARTARTYLSGEAG